MERFIISEIAGKTARMMGVTLKQMRSKSRKRSIVNARNVAMYIARRNTDATLEDIGFVFGRSHSLVLHGINKVEGSRRLITFAKIINDTMKQPT